MKSNIIIIGAGFGGISAACYLAKAGYEVTIIEKNKTVGGRAGLWETKGYKFDLGPSWYMMPEVFDKFFADFGYQTSDFYQLKKLSPQYQFFFPDGDQIVISDQLAVNQQTFERYEPGAGQQLAKYLAVAGKQYQTAIPNFVYKNYTSIWDLVNWRTMKIGIGFNVFESMDSYVKKYFRSEKLQQMIQYSLVFLGGSPATTPAIYNLIGYADYVQGIYYPKGGFYEVSLGLVNLAKKLGVKIILGQSVTKIMTQNGVTTGVRVGSKNYPADIVVSNADYAFTELELLTEESQTYPKSYWDKHVWSPSAFLIFFGVKEKLKKLMHHNLMIGDWQQHFDEIFKNPKLPNQPSYYVCATSKTDPTVAPKGHENLFVLVPIAAGLKINDKQLKLYRDQIVADLERRIDQKFADKIEVEKVMAVKDFEEMYNAYKGNALSGGAHTWLQTAVFRPSNKSGKVENLYYVGAGTVPGIGTPIAVISGQLVAERIVKDNQ